MQIEINKKIFQKVFFIFLLSFLLFSSFDFIQASTTTSGIVPCGLTSAYSDRCTLCHLLKGIDNIVKWGRNVLVVVAMVAIVAGGIMYIISAGNSGAMESAKGVIKQALIGVVIVLGAWVIVSTVLWLIASKSNLGVGVSNWYNFECDSSTSAGGSITIGGTCTGFTYSGWSACQSNGTETRTITAKTPAGCTGGSPGALSQGCPYTGAGGASTCTSFIYSPWSPDPCTSGSTQTRTPTGLPASCTGGTPGQVSRTCGATTTGTIPDACRDYEEAFTQASGGDNNKKCLMVGIAMSESSCNPTAQNGNGCGLMQIEGNDCQYLKDHPTESIQQASQILGNNAGSIAAYNNLSIGNNYTQSGQTITYGNNTYDVGNDDLIASYNGGTGSGTAADGEKQPFALSTDCPNPPTPAWQCNIDPGGFDVTQTYVQNVQRVQKDCLGN